MIIEIVIGLCVALIVGTTYLGFSSPQKFKKVYLYVHLFNVFGFVGMFVWNTAINNSLSVLNEQQSWQAEYNAGLLLPLQVPNPWFWLPSLFFFLYLLGLHYFIFSQSRATKKG